MVIFSVKSNVSGEFNRAIKVFQCQFMIGKLRKGKKVGVEGKVGNECH